MTNEPPPPAAVSSVPIRRALADRLQRVTATIDGSAGLPNACYRDAALFEVERQAIFAENWFCIGFGKDVAGIGDVAPVIAFDTPLVMVRDASNEIRVFHNVCRHRGMRLVTGAGHAGRVIRCPYHSWCYRLDGRLRSTPHVGGSGIHTHDSIDPDRLGLLAVRTAVWFDMVFVNLSGCAPAFDDHIAPLASRWRDFDPSRLVHGGDDSSFSLSVDCNWKLAVENYCESYHLPFVHPDLNRISRLEDHYPIEQPGHFAGQGTRVYQSLRDATGNGFMPLAGLPEFWDTAAEYVALFPNVLLGIHKDHFFAIQLMPDGPDRTVETVEIYYFDPAIRDDGRQDLRARNATAWKQVFIEDVDVVEGMHIGRGASAFDGGVFSAVMDGPTHCFHHWAAIGLLRAIENRRRSEG